MTIIVKKKDKQPPLVFGGHPTFSNKTEQRKYWDNEFERWVSGYNGLTGRHYFYLTMGHIKTTTGAIIRPYWRDGDHEVFWEDEQSRKFKETLAIIKRREFGLTSIYAGNEPVYNCLVNNGSVNLLTSADKDRVKTMFSEKTMVFYDNLPLPEEYMPEKLSIRQDGVLTLSGDNGGFGGGSKVKCLETADNNKNAKRFETERAMSIFLDEWFLHPRADIVFKSSQACLRQGLSTVGHMVIGGSCGGDSEEEKDGVRKSSQLVENMVADSAINRIRVKFISGTICINEADELDGNGRPTGKVVSFMKNGYSDQKRAEEWILKNRSVLEKAKDKSYLYNFIKSYPLTLQEVFDINRMGVFSEEVYASLSHAKKESLAENSEKGIILRKDSKTQKIEVVSSNKSVYTIIEEPHPSKTYLSGTDPIPLSHNISDEGSEYAQVIYCVDDDRAVAYFSRRDLDADRIIGQNILLQEWYKSIEFPNGAPTMIEYNRGEVAMRLYKDFGKEHLLADRPRNLGIVYEESIKGKKGWYSNDKTIARANSYLIKNMIQFADRQRLIRLINEVAIFPNGNLDVLDAYKSALIYLTDYTNGLKKTTQQGWKTKQIPYIGIDKNGNRVRMWHTITIDPSKDD